MFATISTFAVSLLVLLNSILIPFIVVTPTERIPEEMVSPLVDGYSSVDYYFVDNDDFQYARSTAYYGDTIVTQTYTDIDNPYIVGSRVDGFTAIRRFNDFVYTIDVQSEDIDLIEEIKRAYYER